MNSTRVFGLALLLILSIVSSTMIAQSKDIQHQFTTSEENPYLQVAWEHQTMPLYYACERGNYAPACAAMSVTSDMAESVYFDYLAMQYACERGNYAPACDTLSTNTETTFFYEFLPMRYACIFGGYEPACQYINDAQ